VRVDTKVEEETGNRVKVKIEIKEGKRAKIRQINLVGNHTYKQKDVLDTFELKTPNWKSWYKQDDRYSRESLQGDLEKLRNYYMDRGYANFQIDSTQVAIAPEKDDIFITVNLTEGEVFKISDVKLAGTFVVPKAELEKLLIVKPGQTFNQKLITSTQELIQNRLGMDGYAFAKVDPVPTPNNQTHEVSLTFFVDPGNRVYVRNITYNGSNRINDEVMRREMRQLEGGWLSNTSLERSKQRLQRLPYIKNVSFETTPVTGSPDQVDVAFKVEEGPSAQLGGGIGYSETYKFQLNGSYTDANFVGNRSAYFGGVEWRCLQQGLQPAAHQPVHQHRRCVADRVADLSRRHTVRFVLVQLLVEDGERRRDLGLPHHRVPVLAGRRLDRQLTVVDQLDGQRVAGAAVGAAERPCVPAHRPRRFVQQRDRLLRHQLPFL